MASILDILDGFGLGLNVIGQLGSLSAAGDAAQRTRDFRDDPTIPALSNYLRQSFADLTNGEGPMGEYRNQYNQFLSNLMSQGGPGNAAAASLGTLTARPMQRAISPGGGWQMPQSTVNMSQWGHTPRVSITPDLNGINIPPARIPPQNPSRFLDGKPGNPLSDAVNDFADDDILGR